MGGIVKTNLLLAASIAVAVGLLQSPTNQVVALGALPTAPTNLQAAVVQDALLITLLWEDNADNETSYIVERSTAGPGGPWTVITTLPADTTEHTDGGLQDGVTYWYRVGAVNTAGTSYSNVVSGTATALPVPPTDTLTPTASVGPATATPVPTPTLTPTASVGPATATPVPTPTAPLSLPATGAGFVTSASVWPWILAGMGLAFLLAAAAATLWRCQRMTGS